MWFEPNTILSKNRLFNFVIGNRGSGKTTGSIKYGISQHIKKTNYEIGFIRRYKEETKITSSKIFNTIISNNFFPDCEFKVKNKTGYINDSPFINFFTLSTDTRIKGLSSPNIKLLIFDEFTIDRKISRYLPMETDVFLSLYDTIARPSDPSRPRVPVIFLGNNMNFSNPYFDYFNISFNNTGKFQSHSIYAEYLSNHEFTEHAQSTEFAKLIKNTSYYNHAIKNETFSDNFNFIDSKSKAAHPLFNFTFQNITYGVWISWVESKVFISEKFDPSFRHYCFTLQNHSPNVLTAKLFKRTTMFSLVSTAFNTGSMFYENMKIKSVWLDVVRLLNI